jgi:hypothetical protein
MSHFVNTRLFATVEQSCDAGIFPDLYSKYIHASLNNTQFTILITATFLTNGNNPLLNELE